MPLRAIVTLFLSAALVAFASPGNATSMCRVLDIVEDFDTKIESLSLTSAGAPNSTALFRLKRDMQTASRLSLAHGRQGGGQGHSHVAVGEYLKSRKEALRIFDRLGAKALRNFINSPYYHRYDENIARLQKSFQCEEEVPADTFANGEGDKAETANTAGLIGFLVGPIGILTATVSVVTLAVGTALAWSRREQDLARRAFRQPCNLPVEVGFGSGPPLQATIKDISMAGAKIRTDRDIAKGAMLLIRIGETTYSSVVRWSNSHYQGLKFLTPLSETDVAEIIDKHGAQGASRHADSGLGIEKSPSQTAGA